MLSDPSRKYRPFPQVDLPDRRWPTRTITAPPRWLSTDLRDGNQSIIDPMDAVKKNRFFDMLVEIGVKEIEIGFPAAGKTEFDFGRSKVGTGPFSFKRNWGFEPRPITHQYRLLDGGGLPNVNPTNPRYARLIQLWRRLPVPVANRISPLVSRLESR